MNFNRVVIGGHMTREPESRDAAGNTVVSFGIAINHRYTSKSSEKREEVTFVDCEAWNKTGDIVFKYVKKGDPVLVEGRLKLDQWDDKHTGQKRSKLKVVVESVVLCARGVVSNGRTAPVPESADPPLTDDDIPF